LKTTLDIPDDILRNAKAAAAVRGETLRDYVIAAIESQIVLYESSQSRSGWKSVFSLARPSDVAAIDRVVSRDLERIDPGS
jgi:hypothetical protein